MNVKDRTVLVTGANGGLGQALILTLLEAGAQRVYAACRNPQSLTVVDERVVPLTLDVTDAGHIRRAVTLAPDVEVLINNAGLNQQQRLLDTQAPDAACDEMAVNYFGTLNLCRAFAPQLRKRKGAIVSVLSILARVTLPAMGSLCASKAAGLRLAEGMRAELKEAGVQVMAVLPGVIDTAMSRDFPGPKATPRAIAEEIVQGLADNVETLYPDAMAQQVTAGMSRDREGVVRHFSEFL